MLTFPEETLLLLLDDESGKMVRLHDWSMRYALTGAAMMDLALNNRIDSDLTSLILVDATPTGEKCLDICLADIARGGKDQPHEVRYWLEKLAVRADEIREMALDRLVSRGILKRKEELFLWVFRSRCYPAIDGKADREVKLRIMEVLLSDTIPDPRDIAIICLAEACGIFSTILSERELEYSRPRIEQVRRLDLIGQTMSKAIWDIDVSMVSAIQPQGL